MLNVLKIYIYFMMCLNTLGKCCNCDSSKNKTDTVINSSTIPVVKQEQDSDGYLNEYESDDETISTTTSNTVSDTFFNGTEESDFKWTTVTEQSIEQEKCQFFKVAPEFNIEEMEDVWRIVFYKAPEEVSCFKLLFQKVSMANRKLLYEKYGDFNGTVDWMNCQFEMSSSVDRKGKSRKRHFLQGTNKTKGVFENIIIKRSKTGVNIIMGEQSPDQWLVVKNLLLMRDCDNHDVVVFSRLQVMPNLEEIDEALKIFGEDSNNGTLTCKPLMETKYHTLS